MRMGKWYAWVVKRRQTEREKKRRDSSDGEAGYIGKYLDTRGVSLSIVGILVKLGPLTRRVAILTTASVFTKRALLISHKGSE